MARLPNACAGPMDSATRLKISRPLRQTCRRMPSTWPSKAIFTRRSSSRSTTGHGWAACLAMATIPWQSCTTNHCRCAASRPRASSRRGFPNCRGAKAATDAARPGRQLLLSDWNNMPDTTQLPIANYQLPLSRFLSIQATYGPSFSPDGRRLAFLSNITGVPQAWTMEADGGWPSQLTFEKDRVVLVSWSPVADVLIFGRDIDGNENTQLYWVAADGSNERRLTRDDGAMHVFGGWSPDGNTIAFAANRRERGRYDVWVLDLASRAGRLVWQNDAPGFLVPAGFSPDGSRLLVTL